VPIRDVAVQLGLRITGNMVHCWRPENHQHGDRTASVGLHQRRNTAKCFVCDARPLSTIDFVMSVRGLDFPAALEWVTSHYEVPTVAKGQHIQHPGRWPERYRVGASGSALEMLIRSGIWASLTPAQRSIVPVLDTFVDVATRKVTISYRGMMRYAGVRSQSTVSTALKQFQALRFLQLEPRKDSDGIRACGTYKLCFDDPHFLQLANDCRQRHAEQINQERDFRKKERQKRKTARRICTDTTSTTLLEKGTQTPSPSPDLIPAEGERQTNRNRKRGPSQLDYYQ
jgi:hypothetical protein